VRVTLILSNKRVSDIESVKNKMFLVFPLFEFYEQNLMMIMIVNEMSMFGRANMFMRLLFSFQLSICKDWWSCIVNSHGHFFLLVQFISILVIQVFFFKKKKLTNPSKLRWKKNRI